MSKMIYVASKGWVSVPDYDSELVQESLFDRAKARIQGAGSAAATMGRNVAARGRGAVAGAQGNVQGAQNAANQINQNSLVNAAGNAQTTKITSIAKSFVRDLLKLGLAEGDPDDLTNQIVTALNNYQQYRNIDPDPQQQQNQQPQ